MKITHTKISIKDLFEGFKDSEDEGVVGYMGKLNIRPKYQRNFVYKEKEQIAVISTVKKGFPLNTMYWAKNNDESYEIIDGQQRTLSICYYISGDFWVDEMYFSGLTQEDKDNIMNYELSVYICEGTDKEKLEWFKTINIAGAQLTNQELRNAVYTGEWLTDAKKYFSKTNGPAHNLANKYIKAIVNRQELLEVAIKWIALKDNKTIEEYMAQHQQDNDANQLWVYFQKVINWIKTTFPNYRKEMLKVDWGALYYKYKNLDLNTDKLELEIQRLMVDDDVTKKCGIYEYVLSGDERHLSIRNFSDQMKREAYERQKGICLHCKCKFEIEEMQGDHIDPWHMGGKTVSENCQMLCGPCNRRKGGK